MTDTDLVERLRNKVWRDVHLYDAAADEIETLRIDRKAWKKLAEQWMPHGTKWVKQEAEITRLKTVIAEAFDSLVNDDVSGTHLILKTAAKREALDD